MHKLFVAFLMGAALLAPPSAWSQEQRQPHTGSQAVGFEIGSFIPDNDAFQRDLLVNGLFEYYVRPRVSLRTEFGYTDPGHRREPVDSLRQIPLRLDVNYNWEGGAWHPFVGAGMGVYFLRQKDNGRPFGETTTEPGMNVGAGMEYFLSRTVSFKGEGRYHWIGTPINGPDVSGWAITGGLKKYY
jgi:hypothetical protein